MNMHESSRQTPQDVAAEGVCIDSYTLNMGFTMHRLPCGDVCSKEEPSLALYSPELLHAALGAKADLQVVLSSAGAYARRANPRRTVMGGDGVGSAKESHRALRAAHSLTFSCARCGALVDFLASRRAKARRLDRSGCASSRCSARFRRSEFTASQQKMAAAILEGRRVLIRAPYATDAGSVAVIGRAEATSTAHAAITAAAKCAAGGRAAGA